MIGFNVSKLCDTVQVVPVNACLTVAVCETVRFVSPEPSPMNSVAVTEPVILTEPVYSLVSTSLISSTEPLLRKKTLPS